MQRKKIKNRFRQKRITVNNRILFVDDEELILNSFKRKYSGIYEVYTASSAAEAIELIKKSEQFAVVVSDYNMPRMNGIDFLEQVKILTPETIRILLTGYAELNMAINAVNEGNVFRFLTKTADNHKLLVKSIEVALEQFRLVESEKFLKKELNSSYQELKADLLSAAKFQKQYLPSLETIDELELSYIYRPSNFLSSAMLNYFPIDNVKTGFYIIEVPGNGISPAMLSISLSKLIYNDNTNFLSKYSLDKGRRELKLPNEVLTDLNKQFRTRENESESYSLLYGIIDKSTKEISFAQAGFPDALIIEKEDNIIFYGSSDAPIGAMSNPRYKHQKTGFKNDDIFVFFTEGILNCMQEENSGQDAYEILEACVKDSKNNDLKKLSETFEQEVIKKDGYENSNDDLITLFIKWNNNI